MSLCHFSFWFFANNHLRPHFERKQTVRKILELRNIKSSKNSKKEFLLPLILLREVLILRGSTSCSIMTCQKIPIPTSTEWVFYYFAIFNRNQVGRAGRFGTKGLAISFVSTDDEQKILADIQERFAIKIESLPETIDQTVYRNN